MAHVCEDIGRVFVCGFVCGVYVSGQLAGIAYGGSKHCAGWMAAEQIGILVLELQN